MKATMAVNIGGQLWKIKHSELYNMKIIYEALDGRQYQRKEDCEYHDQYLHLLNKAVDEAYDARLFYKLTRPDKVTPIFVVEGYRKFNFVKHGFVIGYHYEIKFKLTGRKLLMIWILKCDDGVYKTFIGTIYLDKLNKP